MNAFEMVVSCAAEGDGEAIFLLVMMLWLLLMPVWILLIALFG